MFKNLMRSKFWIDLARTEEVGTKAGSLKALNRGLAWQARCIGLRWSEQFLWITQSLVYMEFRLRQVDRRA